VDELAHTNVPGSRNEKRWQDIEELLGAGIEVVSTLNIQHLESLNDVVNGITGVVQRETVPDTLVRRADQIELVDMSPEALQRRMAHGNIYKPEKVDASLANFFRLGNLGALRELALLWLADRVEDSLQRYMAQHGIRGAWETRERVLVTLTGAPGGDDLIRRAARMARRTKGDLIGLHVAHGDGLRSEKPELLERHKRVLEELGGNFHEVVGTDVPATLVTFAVAQRATQIVMGTSRRSRWTELMKGSIINRVVRDAKGIDVHVIATEPDPARLRRRPAAPIVSTYNWSRLVGAFVLALCAVVVLGLVIANNSALDTVHKGPLTSSAGLLMFLLVVFAVAAIGGRLPAFMTAVVALAVVDWYLIPPYQSFAIAHGSDVAYLASFLVAAFVGTLAVEQAARRRAEALRLHDETDTILGFADRLARSNPPQVVVEEIHEALHRDAVALLSRAGDGWVVEASTGTPAITTPAGGEHFELRDDHVLVMSGRPLRAEEQCLVAALRSFLDAIVAMHRLRVEASAAEELAHANDLRSALLAAVSHDLRTPLASIRALASGWLEPGVNWRDADTRDFMRTIDSEADRLHKLVENLLDMSRLQSGALQLFNRPTGLDEIVPAALASLGDRARTVVADVPETLPRVDVDPTLLERALANLVDNAMRYSGDGEPVHVEAAFVAGRVDLRVVDRGRGIPVTQRERVFQPFQRLGDTPDNDGVGLGLAVARGFVDAVGGTLTIEDTPGGGVTMVIELPVAEKEPSMERVG
jgi:two-component system sensor histidine kinase KdpD